MEEFEGIDTSRVRFTLTPNFRFDCRTNEVAIGGPDRNGYKLWPLPTLSYVISDSRTLKDIMEEPFYGKTGQKWMVFYRNDNGSVYWEHQDGRRIVRMAQFDPNLNKDYGYAQFRKKNWLVEKLFLCLQRLRKRIATI